MELCGGVLGLGLPLEVYSYQQKVNLKIIPIKLLFKVNGRFADRNLKRYRNNINL